LALLKRRRRCDPGTASPRDSLYRHFPGTTLSMARTEPAGTSTSPVCASGFHHRDPGRMLEKLLTDSSIRAGRSQWVTTRRALRAMHGPSSTTTPACLIH